MVSKLANPEYNTLFYDYLIGGLAQMVVRVRAADPLPDERDREQAWHLLGYAFKQAAAWPYTRELLLTLAPKMEQAGFREDWLAYLQEGHRQAHIRQDGSAIAECALQIGLLYRLLSRFVDAQQWTTVSVVHFATLNDVQGWARALNELAWLEHLQHQYQAATQHVEQALALIDDDNLERAMSYRIKGMIAMGQLDWQQAEQAHGKALNLFQQLGDFRKTAWSQQNLGYALSEQNRLEEAIDLYQQAASTLQHLGDHYHWAIVQMNLGIAYYRLKNIVQAHACHLKAAEIFIKIDDKLNRARIETNLGQTYLELEDYASACLAFKTAIQLYERLGDETWCINAMDGLALVLIASKAYDQALDVLKKALRILPNIQANPYYENLFNKLSTHLQQAQMAQETS